MTDLNCIKIEGLESLISDSVGIKIKFDVSIKMMFPDNPVLMVESQELKEFSGILSNIYKSLKLTNFGGGLSPDKSTYWMPIQFSFDYKRGSNGTHLADYWYDLNRNEWNVGFSKRK